MRNLERRLVKKGGLMVSDGAQFFVGFLFPRVLIVSLVPAGVGGSPGPFPILRGFYVYSIFVIGLAEPSGPLHVFSTRV